jgi:ribosomal protein L11 methyltransferase
VTSEPRTVRVTVITVPAPDAELAADRLWVAGAFAVEERAVADGVELRAQLADSLPIAVEALGSVPDGWRVRIDEVDATPADTWREHAVAIRVDEGLVIRPAWIDPLDEPGTIEVAIEPGDAFGLGDHPTTRLAAVALRRHVRPGTRLLDVGCGTGVLAVVGLLAGAASAIGIDLAPAAVDVSNHNAQLNGVADRLQASTRPLGDVAGSFDVVVSNILAPTLVELADDLRRVTAPHGVLIVSGILVDRHEHVLEALVPLTVVRTEALDGWAAVELRHPPSG